MTEKQFETHKYGCTLSAIGPSDIVICSLFHSMTACDYQVCPFVYWLNRSRSEGAVPNTLDIVENL